MGESLRSTTDQGVYLVLDMLPEELKVLRLTGLSY